MPYIQCIYTIMHLIQYDTMQYNMYIHAYTHPYVDTTHTYICMQYNTCAYI